LSQAEIARKLGVSEQAVSWRVKKLKTRKESQDRDLPTILDDSNYQGNPSIKNQLTAKELKFLEFYLSGEYTIGMSMKAAGYTNYHPKYIHVAARKIIEKYEQQAGDHRKIMRAMGYGETRILQMLIDSAENATSEIVRLNARIALAKCLGLQKEVIGGMQAVTVIIQGSGEQGQPSKPILSAPPALPGPTPYQHPQASAPGKPIQITK